MRLRIINEELSKQDIYDALDEYDELAPSVSDEVIDNKIADAPTDKKPPTLPTKPKEAETDPNDEVQKAQIAINNILNSSKEIKSVIQSKIEKLNEKIGKTKNKKLITFLKDSITKLKNKKSSLESNIFNLNKEFQILYNIYQDGFGKLSVKIKAKEKFNTEFDDIKRRISYIKSYVENFDLDSKPKLGSREGLSNLKKFFIDNYEKIPEEEQKTFRDEFEIMEISLKGINSKIDSVNDEIESKEVDGILAQENRELYSERIELLADITKNLKEFKSKWKIEPERLSKHESLGETDIRGPRWYKKKYEEYIVEVLNIPNVLVHTKDTLRRLSDSSSYSNYMSNADKYGNLLERKTGDKSLISMVASGVKPLAHTISEPRQIYFRWLDREMQQNLAYIPAPSRMGGGAIWYKPYTQIGYRPYGSELKGRDKLKKRDKEGSTRPFDPLRSDPNRNVAELYLWNGIVNKSSPRLFNFINGLCLGYHRDFVIWYCESEYGLKDSRQPDKSFLGRLIDRASYALKNYKDEYGRPGTLNARGPFAFVKRYPWYIRNVFSRSVGRRKSKNDRVVDPFKDSSEAYRDSNRPQKIIDFKDSSEAYRDSNRPRKIIDFKQFRSNKDVKQVLAADIDKKKYRYISESSFFSSLQNRFENL